MSVTKVLDEPTGTKCRILVADDDPYILDLMQAKLEDDRTAVECAEHGLAAQSLLQEHEFDLAIIDLGMPQLDGFELIRHLRADPKTVDLPVMVVTGRDDKQAIEQAFAAGASTFVTKPLNWTLFQFEVQFVIRSGRDKRELRTARDKADRASMAKDNLIQVLSHELRSPLNVLVGFSQVLQRDLQGSLDKTQQAHLRDITEAGERLGEVLSDVLFYSRLNNGEHQLKPSNVLIDELVEDVALTMKTRAAARDISLSHFDETGGRHLIAERKLMLDVVGRLVDNAIKFSPNGSAVSIHAHSGSDGSATISVKDAGPGIPEKTLKRCMRPYEQAHGAMTRTEQGLGLGLAIVKIVAEMHGGKLQVESVSGAGTTASVWMPPKCLSEQVLRKAG